MKKYILFNLLPITLVSCNASLTTIFHNDAYLKLPFISENNIYYNNLLINNINHEFKLPIVSREKLNKIDIKNIILKFDIQKDITLTSFKLEIINQTNNIYNLIFNSNYIKDAK